MRNRSLPNTAPTGAAGSAADDVLAGVGAYFARFGCPRRGGRILAAVSGGPDSVAMLRVLMELAPAHRWRVAVAHVNHGLRGRESQADEAFVRALARRWGLKFHLRRLRPSACPDTANVQMWAREGRYRFFDSLATRFGYDHIAVAHQRDDRAETVAAAIVDGGGTFALSGIPPVRGRIIRPLYDVSRQAILAYLAAAGLSYREDSSNAAAKYQRNRIRARILPVLAAENPAIVEGLARLGEQLWRQRVYLETRAARIVERSLRPSRTGMLALDAGKLARYDEAFDPYVLRDLIKRMGLAIVPTTATVTRFAELRRRHKQAGTVSLEQGQLIMTWSQGALHVARRSARPRPPVPSLRTRVVAPSAQRRADDRRLARFDLDRLAGAVTIRWPRPGDRYRPLGLPGTKSLSELLADRKVPSFERPFVPVVVDDQGIVWPVGFPIAERVRLTSRTRRVLEARVVEGSWKKTS
ncbi:MAG TPA: tRNA lysidine(34) synthetase TilS [bacterium]|nr:tRNA lysidine(34) synthetase TilS [bacterium]